MRDAVQSRESEDVHNHPHISTFGRVCLSWASSHLSGAERGNVGIPFKQMTIIFLSDALMELALKEAHKLPLFKGKNLNAKFLTHERDHIDGIEVSVSEDEE